MKSEEKIRTRLEGLIVARKDQLAKGNESMLDIYTNLIDELCWILEDVHSEMNSQRVVRTGVFETNSSSNHSLIIVESEMNNKWQGEVPKRLEPVYLEEGRNFSYDTVEEKYTALIVMADRCNKLIDALKMLKSIGVEECILSKYSGEYSAWGIPGIGGPGCGEIDSPEEYVMEIIESEDALKRYLFDAESSLWGEDNNY